MIAYVFWHWPSADHATDEYEQLQRAFHAALAKSAPSGFMRSVVFAITGKAPWLGGSPSYADWYLVEDSAALDALNVAAVSGICEEPHNEVARAMAAGAGSLLTLRGEGDSDPDLTAARHLTWLTKPRPMPYADFYTAAAAPQGSSFWRRTMVLGPNPEFGILSASRPTGLGEFSPLTLELNPIWP
jgi:hypothetical protein